MGLADTNRFKHGIIFVLCVGLADEEEIDYYIISVVHVSIAGPTPSC